MEETNISVEEDLSKVLPKEIEMQMIFEELCKGRSSVLTPNVNNLLANTAVEMIQKPEHTNAEIKTMKYLLMICNILYNRTDMLVLPVEDGVYDLLLEAYKKYDKNFQVGAVVVQFKDRLFKDNPDLKEVTCPIFYYPKTERNEIRQEIFDRLSSYDKNKFDKDDFVKSPIYYDPGYITKRTHNTKHEHPQLVGTLDKAKFTTISEAVEAGADLNDPNLVIFERDFLQKHISMGIIDPNTELEFVLELKYDGISVEADCDHEVQSARSRGDTGIGEAVDYTPILKGYQFHHNHIITDRTIGVKFEAIMTKTNLSIFNKLKNYNYANCRVAMIGLSGASDAYKYRDLITLVPLAVDRDQVPEISNRIEEIEFCNRLFRSHGEPLRYMYIKGSYNECLYMIKNFADEALAFRDYADFMYDGIVVSYLDENIRARLGRENNINKYSIAIKFNPMSKLTRFLGYTFEVGQNGTITPMFHYSPVEFFGTIHTKSSGSSYKRFMDNKLKVGDIVQVTYRNDVMPYLTTVDCEENRLNKNPIEKFPTHCPICGTELILSDSGKTAICPNIMCQGRVLGRMTNMLQKMNIKGFAESSVAQLGCTTFKDLMLIPKEKVADILGPGNAENFEAARQSIMNGGLEDYRLIGSLGFTGLAQQTWKLIFDRYTLKELLHIFDTGEGEYQLDAIKGIGRVATTTIMKEYLLFRDDMHFIADNVKYIDTKGQLDGKLSIRFTGCRNLQLCEQLRNLGHDADGNAGVTKKTDILIIPYSGFTSNKTSKVGPDCIIVPESEFINKMDYYLQLKVTR